MNENPKGEIVVGKVFLEKVGPENYQGCGIGCLTNRKHEGHGPKLDWLEKRFKEGLRYFLFRDDKGKPLAFLEYVPGEHAWRPVHADGWLFVHCLWVYSRGQRIGGLGGELVKISIQEARDRGDLGVAAMVSDGPWMVGAEVFLKNGFKRVAAADRFELVSHRLREGPEPRFRDIGGNLAAYKGLNLVYSPQCPMLPKSARDLAEMAAEHGLELKVSVLRSPREAQKAPSYYGVFSLIWNGRLLSDHYVSKGRFKNLLKKEILPEIS